MDPKTLVDILVNLAVLEANLADANARLARGEQRERLLTELQGEYAADAEHAAEARVDMDLTVRGSEADIRRVEARIADRRDKIIGLTDRRQVRALQEEIAGLEKTLDDLETRTLEAMDQQEASGEEAESAKLVSHWKGRESDRELAEIRAERATLTAARRRDAEELERVIHLLPAADQRTVLRLRTKLDQSVVNHHNGACAGCFHQLPAQQAIDVDRGRAVVRCPSCTRYIVHRPWT